MPDGRYAIIEAEEFPLFVAKSRRWYATSWSPRLGFVPNPYGSYDYWPAEDEWLECVDYTHTGTYRDIPVVVTPNAVGTLMLTMHTGEAEHPHTDDNAVAQGFDYYDRAMWAKVVQPDDPDLEVVTTREPIDPPWFKAKEPRT